MLKMLIALALGGQEPSHEPIDSASFRAVLVGGDLGSIDDAFWRADVEKLFELGDVVGERLLGLSETDFESRLLDIYDDDDFAELIGRYFIVSLSLASEPELADYVSHAPPPSSPLAKRFAAGLARLNAMVGSSLPALHLQSLEVTPLLSKDPVAIGREYIEVLCDPTTSLLSLRVHTSVCRTIARALVVRRLERGDIPVRSEFVQGLFAKSDADTSNLAGLIAAVTGQDPPEGAPRIDFRDERRTRRFNEYMLEAAKHSARIDPDAWERKFCRADERIR